jgi:hypothetical protein
VRREGYRQLTGKAPDACVFAGKPAATRARRRWAAYYFSRGLHRVCAYHRATDGELREAMKTATRRILTCCCERVEEIMVSSETRGVFLGDVMRLHHNTTNVSEADVRSRDTSSSLLDVFLTRFLNHLGYVSSLAVATPVGFLSLVCACHPRLSSFPRISLSPCLACYPHQV